MPMKSLSIRALISGPRAIISRLVLPNSVENATKGGVEGATDGNTDDSKRRIEK